MDIFRIMEIDNDKDIIEELKKHIEVD